MNKARPLPEQATRRVEDIPLVRGEGRFCDDAVFDGQLAAVFVRSVHAHAAIRGVDTSAALDLAGVVTVLTADDMVTAGVGNVARPPMLTGRDGRPLIVPHRPALARERVIHVGEPIALVIARTQAIARDAADLVAVDYEALPGVSDASAALIEGAPVVSPEAPGNLAIDWSPPALSEASVEVASIMATAAHVVRMRLVNQRLVGVPMETRGATAIFDAGANKFTLHAPSQSAHALKNNLCAIMGLDSDQLRVLSGDVGGAFGLKTPPYPEHAALLVAAKVTDRPVHWMATRSEAFLADHHGRDNVSEIALALDDDGRFLALDVSAIANVGAHLSSSGVPIATMGFANCFPGMYDIRHIAIRVRLAFTNTVPTGAYRGAGRPEANYAIERVIDAAARQTGIDPLELRRRNLIPASAMPYRSVIGNVYDSGDFAGAIAKAAGLARLDTFAARRAEAERRGKRRGIGVSCFLEHAGGGPTEGALFTFDGDVLRVRLGMQASGQGHGTVFRKVAAERLGIAANQVVIDEGDSDVPFRGGPAVGSRSTNAAGAAIVDGAAKLVARAREVAAGLWQTDATDVGYRDGYVEVAGTNHRLSLFELAARAGETGVSLTTVAQADATSTYPNGCHIAEVEIDPETGVTTLVSYAAVDDCGVVIDRTLAEGQVVGGLAQGFGQALMERAIYDDAGQLLTGSLMDYAMPRADDMPPIVSAFHEIPCTTNTLGVKGIGEAGPTASLAAVMNAIADAIPGWARTSTCRPRPRKYGAPAPACGAVRRRRRKPALPLSRRASPERSDRTPRGSYACRSSRRPAWQAARGRGRACSAAIAAR